MVFLFIEAIVQRCWPTDGGSQYKQTPQSIALVKIAHAKKYSSKPKFSINTTRRSDVVSILTGARRHHVKHPDVGGPP
jgi:hypothetical protein